MKRSSIVALVALSIFSACSKKGVTSYPELNAAPLVVIAHDAKGKLQDFRVIKDLENVKAVTITPGGGGKEVYVTVLGTQRDASLSADTSMGTMDAVGYRGTISVVIEGGKAIRVEGNSMLNPSPLSQESLDKVSSGLAGGQLLPTDQSLIAVE